MRSARGSFRTVAALAVSASLMVAGCTSHTSSSAPTGSGAGATGTKTSVGSPGSSSASAATPSSSAATPSSSASPAAAADPAQQAAAKPHLDSRGIRFNVEAEMPTYRVAEGSACVVIGDLLDGELKRHLRECEAAVKRVRGTWPASLRPGKVLLLAPESDAAFARLLDPGTEPSQVEGMSAISVGRYVVARHLGGDSEEDQVYALTSEVFLDRTWTGETSGGVEWIPAGTSLWVAEHSDPVGAMSPAEMLYDTPPPAEATEHLPADGATSETEYGWPLTYAAATFVVENFGLPALRKLYERQQTPFLTDDEAVRPVLGISYAELDRRYSSWIKRQLVDAPPGDPGDDGESPA